MHHGGEPVWGGGGHGGREVAGVVDRGVQQLDDSRYIRATPAISN
jgi:hypothetical protein